MNTAKFDVESQRCMKNVMELYVMNTSQKTEGQYAIIYKKT